MTTLTALALLGMSSVVLADPPAKVNVNASAPVPVQVTPIMPVGPIMPPTALPPLPPMPNGALGPSLGMPSFTDTIEPRLRRAPPVVQAPVFHPVKPCPTAKLFANNIMIFDNEASADLCEGGVLHPGMKVGDGFAGVKIVAIDEDGVTIAGRHGKQKLSTSSK